MKVILIKKQDEARSTKSFFFEPQETFSWQPGQYFYITLPRLIYPDERGDTRHFTISSSPTEGKLIRLTTRIRDESGYKKTLEELPIGTELQGKGPNGLFVLNEKSSKQNILIAGGIGITPFRAFIKYNVDNHLGLDFKLIYSNSDAEFVFKEELDGFSKSSDNLKIKYINTTIDGRIDQLKIANCIKEWHLEIKNIKWWIVGPPPFVTAIEDILKNLRVSEDSIETEKFTGY